MNKNDLEFLIVCACRYNIGRMTCYPPWFCDIVEKQINTLSHRCLTNILRDIQKAESDWRGLATDAEHWRDLKQKIEARLQDD
jgi:hypothetical protein